MDNKKKILIRRLTPLIKDLIQNTFVIQAMNLERTIASTFEPSSEMQQKLGGMPANYREMINKIYSKYMFRAYEMGMGAADHSIHIENADRIKEELATKCPMPYAEVLECLNAFTKETLEYLGALPTKQEAYEQFKLDLSQSYIDGYHDALTKDKMADVPKVTTAAPEPAQIDPNISNLIKTLLSKYPVVKTLSPGVIVSFLMNKAKDSQIQLPIEEVKAAEMQVLHPNTLLDVEDVSKEEVIKVLNKVGIDYDKVFMSKQEDKVILANIDRMLPPRTNQDVAIDHIEKYVELLGPEKAKIMKYAMGLPSAVIEEPAAVITANVEEPAAGIPVVEPKLVGPYEPQELRGRILTTLKNSSPAEIDNLKYISIDCLVAGAENMTDDELAKSIKAKIPDLVVPDESAKAVLDAMDTLAATLSGSVNLPGVLLFLDFDGDYCLTFAFNPEEELQLAVLNNTVVQADATASMVNTPAGPIVVSKQQEIEALCGLGSLRKAYLKDIKRASPAAYNCLNQCISDARGGKLRIGELERSLSMSMQELIEKVYGLDGVAYYKHLCGKQ